MVEMFKLDYITPIIGYLISSLWKDIKVRLVSSFICDGFTTVIDHSFFCL